MTEHMAETMREWLTRRNYLITPAMEEDKAFMDGPAPPPAIRNRVEHYNLHIEWDEGCTEGQAFEMSEQIVALLRTLPVRGESHLERITGEPITDASSNSAANEGADYVIADAIRRRIPDFRMPELMAWDIIRALEQASLTIGRSIPNRMCPACGDPLGDDHECLDDRNLRDATPKREAEMHNVTQGPPLTPPKPNSERTARAKLWQAVWETSQFCDAEEIRRIVKGTLREIESDEP